MRAQEAGLRFEAQQLLFPEQTAQDGLDVEREQLVAREARRQDRDAVVFLVAADLVLVRFIVRLLRGAFEVALALDGQALDQQAGRHLVVGGEHQRGVELFALQHVVLQHVAELAQLLAVVAEQRHDALVRRGAGQLVFRVERDGAAALVVHVDHVGQARVGRQVADHLGGGAQAQVGLGLGHRHLHGAVAEDLQDQRAVELDVGLHQRGRGRHLAEQFGHRRRVRAGGGVGGAPRKDLLPRIRQAHDHAAHRQAIEQEFVQLAQNGIFLSVPARVRRFS
ncbi:hypothetical protein D3C72_1023890 [compost metagenome]